MNPTLRSRNRSPIKLAVSGWFSGRGVGSGQYTDALVAALADTALPAEQIRLVYPRWGAGRVAKLLFEQAHFPLWTSECDIAHVPYWAPPVRPSVPTVVTIHDLIPLLLPEYRRSVSSRAYTALVARASSSASAIIADSDHTARDIAQHLPVSAERIHTVPLGVDRRYFAEPRAASDSTRHLADLPPRYGLYLGGYDVRKNLRTLVAAWQRVYAATGVPLVLAGRLPTAGDPLVPDPLRMARDAGLPGDALVPIGYVSEEAKPSLYGRALVFAFPSIYEGFGLPPLEAMASGAPVVVADATSLPEVVGEAALRVEPLDAGAWADSLCRAIEDRALAARLGASGRKRAACFSWGNAAEQTRAVYCHVLRQLD